MHEIENAQYFFLLTMLEKTPYQSIFS